jgi:hypothetical protein
LWPTNPVALPSRRQVEQSWEGIQDRRADLCAHGFDKRRLNRRQITPRPLPGYDFSSILDRIVREWLASLPPE